MIVDAINAGTRRIPSWTLYVLFALPPAWLLYSGLTGGLGVDPVKAMEHQMGEWALWLLIAGLAFTPLRNQLGINLIKFRRAIGLVTFFYVLAHLLIWLVLDVQIPSQIAADIIKRPYISLGMASFVIMIPLAFTSNNASIRKLGAGTWRTLHKAVYGAALLGGLHFVWLVRGWQVEPFIYLAVIIFLLALRIPQMKRVKLA